MSRARPGALMLGALAALCGCNLFNTGDAELPGGRGPRGFDPYVGEGSGAIRLSLQLFNGCAIGANGEPFGKGTMDLPDYPATCQDVTARQPAVTAITPARAMPLLAGATYYLNQITIAEIAIGRHTDPADLNAPLEWIRTQTVFKDLDWAGAGVTLDEWKATRSWGAWERNVIYGNAAWMLAADDSFTVEVLDPTGVVRAGPVTYGRGDFMLENPIGGHTQFGWQYENVGRPEYPDDKRLLNAPTPMLGMGAAPPKSFKSMARLDREGSTDPFTKQISLPLTLEGPAAIRLTWSLMPDKPFYFPVELLRREQLPATCYVEGDPAARVPCGFGLHPDVRFTEPANGQFYVPGETFELALQLHDENGHLLHPEDKLPTWTAAMKDQANGILYYFLQHTGTYREREIGTMFKVVGPLQALRPPYEPAFIEHTEFFQYPPGRGYLPVDSVMANEAPGVRDLTVPTRIPITLPPDAQPGTYVALLKGNRYFLGERTNRTVPVYFQVGQAQSTRYPQRVGNCQICHRGPITLDNLQMGLPEDDTEVCKACHGPGPTREVHQTHVMSAKWPRSRADCATCHLTRESALRPSLWVCGACHPQPHGTMFFEQSMTSRDWSPEPNVLSNCAESCHAKTPPRMHLLPPEVTQ